mmetsp:Transcript_26198/g.57499  ORF Transcript_26198/g.57499 Transcript_26198/m.57499 type:complete len:247 (+) Transcript_26198:138-878(+)
MSFISSVTSQAARIGARRNPSCQTIARYARSTSITLRQAQSSRIRSHDLTSVQTRPLSFSFAGPRKLDEILKVDMIEDKSSTDVEDLWLGYHETKDHQEGIVIDGKVAKSILARAAQCPFFIQPIFRDDGYFTLVSQFQTPNHFLLAYLEDYKMDPARAQPLITFSIFSDLVSSHGIGLIRADIINKGIADDEGLRCVNELLDAYGKDEIFSMSVHAFNKKPESFDFDDYISQQNQKWKNDDQKNE